MSQRGTREIYLSFYTVLIHGDILFLRAPRKWLTKSCFLEMFRYSFEGELRLYSDQSSTCRHLCQNAILLKKKNQEQGKRSPFPFSWPLAHYHFNRKNELRPLTSTWCAWHDLSIACEVQLTWWWGHFKAVICYLNNTKTQISRVENVYTLHAYFSRLTNDTGCGKWRGGKRWHLGRVNRGVSPTALETG